MPVLVCGGEPSETHETVAPSFVGAKTKTISVGMRQMM